MSLFEEIQEKKYNYYKQNGVDANIVVMNHEQYQKLKAERDTIMPVIATQN